MVIFMNHKPQIAVILLLLQSPMTIFVLKSPGFRKLGYSSEMQNDALMHLEGLYG